MSAERNSRDPSDTRPGMIVLVGADLQADWLKQTGELVRRALGVLDDDDEILQSMAGDAGNGCLAWELIFGARQLLLTDSADIQLASCMTYPSNYYGDVIILARSMLVAVQNMKDTHRALPAMLEPAVAALKEIGDPLERTDGHTPINRRAIAAPAASPQAGGVFEAADAISSNVAYAQTLAHMLFDLIGDDDSEYLLTDGPARRDQRMYATVEALQARLKAIEKVESQLREMAHA